MATNDGETPGPFDKLVNFMEKLNERISRIENERVDNQQLIGQSTNPPVIRQKSNHENYVLSQIVKYDGKNLKHWLSSVKAAFKSCGYSHFLESELEATHPDYHLYQNCLGTISLTFVPEKFEIIEHCKSVYQVWKHMSQVEKDTYATAVRKQTELMSCKYNGGSLRSWLETIIAKFESIESEWCTYSDKHRCVIVMSMLRSMGNFEQLADRIMMNQKGTMNDIMNEFIEHDEKQKSQSIITNIVSREKAQLVKKKQFKSDVKCSFCFKNGHKTDECWTKQKIEKQKLISNSSSKVETSTPSSSNANDKEPKICTKRMAKSLLLTTVKKSPDVWILDSGCTSHITNNENCLIDPEEKEIEFEIASGKTVKSKKTGIVHLNPEPNCELVLTDVAFGNFNSNLLSLSRLAEDGFKIEFGKNNARIFRDDVSFTANIDENNLWTINSKPKENKIFNLWHKRLAHCGQKTIKRIRKIVSQIDKNIETCEDCMLNKSVSAPHNHPMKYNVKPFELLHVDLWQAPVSSCQGSKYGMLIVDHNTRFVFGIPIASKSDAADKLIKFIEQNEKRLKCKVKSIRTDRGTEFVNNQFKTFCENNDIEHQLTCAYSPQQNGVVERMNRTVFETVRVMLNSAKAPQQLWAETMCSAIYVINTWIRKDGKSPYEKLYSKQPNYDNLRVFGCEVKCPQMSERLMFIGYTNKIGCYRLLNPQTLDIIISNNVQFNERKMYYERFDSENLSEVTSSSNFDLMNCNEDNDDYISNYENESSYEQTNQNEELDSTDSTTTTSTNEISAEPRRSSRINKGVPPIRYGYKCIERIPNNGESNSIGQNEFIREITKESDQLKKCKTVWFNGSRKLLQFVTTDIVFDLIKNI